MRDKPFFVLKDVSSRLEISLQDRVRFLLLRLGRSQNWLADQVGISKATLSRFLRGHWDISSIHKIRMAEILEVDSLVLFGPQEYLKEFHTKTKYNTEDKNGRDV